MNLHDEFMFCNQQIISTVYILSLLFWVKWVVIVFFSFFKPWMILFFSCALPFLLLYLLLVEEDFIGDHVYFLKNSTRK
jgi:hypothetical protein